MHVNNKHTIKRLIIAIDGPAASGKSTSAKRIAELLSLTYIDTGAMYRASGLAAKLNNVDLDDLSSLARLLENINIEFRQSEEKQRIFLNGNDVSIRIRETDITKLSSLIAVIPLVREKLVKMQQDMGKKGGVVMDGRDIGTVVFPSADFKFFLTANTKVRALRRWKEIPDRSITLEEIEKELIWRDHNDTSRETSPLVKAADAIEIDTSDITVEEQINYMYNIIITALDANYKI